MIDFLRYQNDEYKELKDYIDTLTIASLGGRKANTTEYKLKLLKDANDKPLDVKESIAKSAYFDSRIADIVHLIISHLFKDKAVYEGSRDNFWVDWFTDCTFNNKDFHSFLKSAFLMCLIQQKVFIQVDTNNVPAIDLKTQQELMGNVPFLILRNRLDVWDYSSDRNELNFIKIHNYHKVATDRRANLYDHYHEFLVYERKENKIVYGSKYQVRKTIDRDKDFTIKELMELDKSHLEITEVFSDIEIFNYQNNYPFPVVYLEIDDILWLCDRLFPIQKRLFVTEAGVDSAIDKTNFSILLVEGVSSAHNLDSNNPVRHNTLENGYFLELEEGQDIRWLEKDTRGADLGLNRVKLLETKMLEKVSAISSIAASRFFPQSGEAKKEDRRNLDILLEVYGQEIATLAKNILDVCSIAFGEVVDWSVNGFNDYDSEGLLDNLEKYLAVEKASINSETLRKELQKAIAHQALSEINNDTDKVNTVLKEVDSQAAFTLDDNEYRLLFDMWTQGLLSQKGFLAIMQKGGLLPFDFDIDAEVNQSTAIAPEDNILS